MKIKSKLAFNTIIPVKRTKGSTPTGAGLEIPAGSTVQMTDAEWAPYAEDAADLIKSGSLVVVDAPELSDEEKAEAEAKELAEAQAVVARLSGNSAEEIEFDDE